MILPDMFKPSQNQEGQYNTTRILIIPIIGVALGIEMYIITSYNYIRIVYNSILTIIVVGL